MVRRDTLNVQRQGHSQDMGGVNVTVHVNPNIIYQYELGTIQMNNKRAFPLIRMPNSHHRVV